MLDRLVGLETEYAVGGDSGTASLHRVLVYRGIVDALRERLPLALAKHFKDGVFLANGGAVWYESERPSTGSGLIEGSTPECRGALETIAYQRAQDDLLADAARRSRQPCVLLKNDRDARDNVYGAQENYEATVADGWRLAAWRIGLTALLPLAVVTWFSFLALILVLVLYFVLAGLLWPLIRDQKRLMASLFGDSELGMPTPRWLEPVLLWVIRIINAPLAIGLWVLCHWFAFCRIRRQLTGLLITRCVVTGAGRLDDQRRFHLADKAGAINCLVGFGGYFRDRPLYTMGHFFKALCIEAMFSFRSYLRLYRRRQRLQIGLGDSNMADIAGFLRIGTTLLVLDAIESGSLRGAPRFWRPIAALHAFSRDSSLRQAVAVRGGQRMTAVDVQRWYLNACRQYLLRSETPTEEAFEILHCWGAALDALDRYADDGVLPESLRGEIDWVTKKQLIDHAGMDATWESLKKIDLRYHELSPNGYFMRLRDAGLSRQLVSSSLLDRSQRMPPADSPAATRGRFIREFSADGYSVQANWFEVRINDGSRTRVIHLGADTKRKVRNRITPPSDSRPAKRQ